MEKKEREREKKKEIVGKLTYFSLGRTRHHVYDGIAHEAQED